MIRRRAVVSAIAVAGWGAFTPDAAAHGFGQRYDLPLPLALYVGGAGAVVLLSFVLAALFLRRGADLAGYPRLDLLRTPLGGALAHPATAAAVKMFGLAAFVLVVACGWLGNPGPARNLAPTTVWIVWWVGLAFVSALVGNLWTLLNPWRTAFGWAEALAVRARRGQRSGSQPELLFGMGWRRPAWLGAWPAVALFLAFAWLELVSPAGATPETLARAIAVYSVVTWAGMFAFGREAWLRTGEPFTLFFGFFARFAPTEIRIVGASTCAECPVDCAGADGDCIDCAACFARADPARRELALRPFAAGLLRHERVHPSITCFAILLLGTVSFDGLKETPFWAEVHRTLAVGSDGSTRVNGLGLVAVPLALGAAYAVTMRAMAAATGGRRPDASWGSFAVSLVPIAIGYHLAHYFSFLLVQGQLLIPLLSDPFGWGWNLFGTAGYRIDIAVVGARFVWSWSIGAIVTGHVVGVVVAHHLALRAFDSPREVLRSQIPMLVLMVGYTMLSLWIIAQPIVEPPTG